MAGFEKPTKWDERRGDLRNARNEESCVDERRDYIVAPFVKA